MEKQQPVMKKRDAVEAEVELEFIGTLENVTQGWAGPVPDWWHGDWVE